jgi:alkaline phosphatase
MNVARIPKALLALLALAVALPALAAPANVAIVPPDGARFLAYQRFDVRVEGKGTGPFSATVAVDGVPQAFTSGAQNTTSTDGITTAGWGGFNLRGFSSAEPGWHTLTATFEDATGSVTKTSRFEVVNAFGKRGARGGSTGKPAKNIIIMLGDGMGVAHRTAARLVKYGVTAGQPDGYLAMDRFPGTGLVTTHSLNSIITDSAPGMACYSTGSHANNGQEGVYPAHVTSPFFAPRVEYMAEYLHRVKGTSLGLVTTADVEDATPAANAVHTADRNAGTGVCDQYLDESDALGTGASGTGLAVLMGGGRRWFLPSTAYGSSRSAGTDYPQLPADLVSGWSLPAAASGGLDPGRDLIAGFQAAGFAYADSRTALDGLTSRDAPDKLLGLFGYGNMNVALDKVNYRRGVKPEGRTTYVVEDYHAPDQPMLDEMAEAALKVLSRNENGFVLMVEGAHIDKQSHLMDADRVIGETIEFDAAVGVARRWADRLGDTVVVVLADHECSGFSLIGALAGGVQNLRSLPPENALLDPGSIPLRQRAVGTYDAAGFPRYEILPDGYPRTMDVDGKVLVGFGANSDRYEGWLSKPLPVIDSLLPATFKAELAKSGYAGIPAGRAESQFGYFVRGQLDGAGQAVHTAADIPISAYSAGNGAWKLFSGVQTNTDVYFKLMRAALGGATDDDRPDRD